MIQAKTRVTAKIIEMLMNYDSILSCVFPPLSKFMALAPLKAQCYTPDGDGRRYHNNKIVIILSASTRTANESRFVTTPWRLY
jgi:hypothetical protein